METVPTTKRLARVQLECGAIALVKRIKASASNDILASIGNTGDAAVAARHVELVVRAAMEGVEGELKDDEGAVVPFRAAAHPGVGRIATREVYDALTSEDAAAVYKAALTRLTEIQSGN